MKCDNCKFERQSESENGTECYCNIFGEDIPVLKDAGPMPGMESFYEEYN